MLAFFAWSEEPKPLVNAPLFELYEKTSKRACFGDAVVTISAGSRLKTNYQDSRKSSLCVSLVAHVAHCKTFVCYIRYHF